MEKDLIEKVRTSMMEVFQEQTDKFYRSMGSRNFMDDSESYS